jgi:hypothetical protein
MLDSVPADSARAPAAMADGGDLRLVIPTEGAVARGRQEFNDGRGPERVSGVIQDLDDGMATWARTTL